MSANSLLVMGLFFPIISFFSALVCLYSWLKHRQHSASIFVPFIGPVLLTAWIFTSGKSAWLIPVVWLGDAGTIAFVIMSPRLISQWWEISSLTKILEIRGSEGIASAILSLHSTKRYHLRKRWHRSKEETGIVGLGELGLFVKTDRGFQMTSDGGWTRQLIKIADDKFQIQEDESVIKNHTDYSVQNWVFEKRGMGK